MDVSITKGVNIRKEDTLQELTRIINNFKSKKVYRALLTQSGVVAPTATVLENTLGGTVVWTYVGVGEYRGTLTGAFTLNKTFILSNASVDLGDVEGPIVVRNFVTWRKNVNSVEVITDDNNILINNSIEITVYV